MSSEPSFSHAQLRGTDASAAKELTNRAHLLSEQGYLGEAEILLRRAIKMAPHLAMAHNNLGYILAEVGRTQEAITLYRRAIELEAGLVVAQVNLARVLFKSGARQLANDTLISISRVEIVDKPILNKLIDIALENDEYSVADKFARHLHELSRNPKTDPDLLDNSLAYELTHPALKHQLAQLEYLEEEKIMVPSLSSLVSRFKEVIETNERGDVNYRRALNDREKSLIGSAFNRAIYYQETPAVPDDAIFGPWDSAQIEEDYCSREYGICIIDNFLSPLALGLVRDFCLRSTIWHANKYAHGRLGSFFRDGFSCPLLGQIAAAAKKRLPRVITRDQHLTQLWGFKYPYSQPTTHPHADFASVNLNFWITPDEANQNPPEGGLRIFDVAAPAGWDFDKYNKSGNLISHYLQSRRASSLTVHYQCNRAILFNSDLFHSTAPFRFREDYRSRRINITMLYGHRGHA